MSTKRLTSAEVTEIRAKCDDPNDCASWIPALCDSHEVLERENAMAQAILQAAPKPWITDRNYPGPEWMEEYRRWWIRRLPGTAELLDGTEA